MSRAVGRYGGTAAGVWSWCRLRRLMQISAFGAILLTVLPPYRLTAQDVEKGRVIYDKWCAGCHGDTGAGDGEGAAFMLPPPRDFTRAFYQIRTTATGELPTDADIRRMIDEGMPGTAMPGWKDHLSNRERDDLVAYLKSFSRDFDGPAPEALDFGSPPGESDEGIAEGRRVFQQLECFKCHGDQGRGDGPSAPTLTDDWDFPIRTANLSQPWTFNGGGRVEDIYRRLRTGLDGTPMPSNSDVVDAGLITDEQLWRVAQYVRSLAPRETPAARDVIRAVLVDGGLPAGPSDSVWDAIEPAYIPLVGQIIVAPRSFAPRVTALWVQAVHNSEQLALRLSWDDPSRSPDPDWQEWVDRVAQTMTDADGAIPTAQGPDRLTMQFPGRLSDDEPPFFLGGDTQRPVYMWRWSSDPDRLEVGTATGLETFTPHAGASETSHTARFNQGQWQLQVSRSIVPADTSIAPTFTPARAIPIAFFAADGSNGEVGDTRGSISAWYAIYLDIPTPARAYAVPVFVMLITAGLGGMVVWRAQQRDRQGRRS